MIGFHKQGKPLRNLHLVFLRILVQNINRAVQGSLKMVLGQYWKKKKAAGKTLRRQFVHDFTVCDP